MSRWKKFNPNPSARRVGDCVIRAICKALDIDWETTFSGVMVKACRCRICRLANVFGEHISGNMVSAGTSWTTHSQYVYTVDDFCRDHPVGTYILAIDGHVVCVQDGFYWDTWDSGQEIPIYYWER